MSHCKYHPLEVATQACGHCTTTLCGTCTHKDRDTEIRRCLLCGNETAALGAGADVEPFWRRIDQAFRYPMKAEALVLIGVVSLLTAVSSFFALPFMAGIGLLTTGVIVKYCFNCLTATAKGEMTAPDITTAYEGGGLLVGRLLLAMVVMMMVVGALFAKVSPAVASLVGFLIIVGLPAMIIIYAMTENMLEALNPLNLLALIAKIGLPYGLILAILMIMMASVELLSELIGYGESVFIITLQSAVSNYYSIVMFYLMGYMIFQYQHELGFVAEVNDGEFKAQRLEQEKARSRIQILIKEGHWGTAENEFRQGLKKFADDEALNTDFFQFTLAVLPENAQAGPRAEAAISVFDGYFSYLLRAAKKEMLYTEYARANVALRSYIPKRPELRYEIAKVCQTNGNPRAAVKLLNGLHKAHPTYAHLVLAYGVLVSALDDIPKMEAHAQQARKMVAALKKRAQAQGTSTGVGTKANFHNIAKPSPYKPERASSPSEPKPEPKPADGNKGDLPPIEFKL